MALTTPIVAFTTASISPDTASIGANDTVTTFITVTGVAVGDIVVAQPNGELVSSGDELSYYVPGPVSTINQVPLAFVNSTGGALTVQALVWTVVVINRYANTAEFPESVV